MGIPYYFSHIVKSYSGVIRSFDGSLICDNLYFDGNSIIYDELHKICNMSDTTSAAIDRLIFNVCEKLDCYIKEIQPRQKVLICFDGVAPIAKLEQQRSRRYKSTLEKDYYKTHWDNIEKVRKLTDEEESVSTRQKPKNNIDTSIITPGTAFYRQLNSYCHKYFNTDKKSEYNVDELIFSGSDFPGEGEHKIFEKIRSESEYHKSTKTFIYGIDSDLIMLSLNHTMLSDFNIYLYRETPHFIQSIDKSLTPNHTYVIDVPTLALSIMKYMNGNNDTSNNSKNKVHDYIFLCFMLGNDFVPKIPSINIRRNGIDYILRAYTQVITKESSNIINGLSIDWRIFGKVIAYMSNIEELVLKKEMTFRNKLASTSRNAMQGYFSTDIGRYYNCAPLLNRNSECDIKLWNAGWHERFYKILFQTGEIQKICHNYLESMEWCYYYYSNGCCDKTWKYNFHYGPLLKDLMMHIPTYKPQFKATICTKPPISELSLLCYVTPKIHLGLLPAHISSLLLQKHPEWYQDQWHLEYSFCMYTWESHVVMSKIDIDELQQILTGE
tara:strand:+ start:2527 stop:4182 length:1656 start_codon:yes stop_codon:yes gene_type:complete